MGYFTFLRGWCLAVWVYAFFVPEILALVVEEIKFLFEGPWYNACKLTKKPAAEELSSD